MIKRPITEKFKDTIKTNVLKLDQWLSIYKYKYILIRVSVISWKQLLNFAVTANNEQWYTDQYFVYKPNNL